MANTMCAYVLRHCSLKNAQHANLAFFVRNFPIFLWLRQLSAVSGHLSCIEWVDGQIVLAKKKEGKNRSSMEHAAGHAWVHMNMWVGGGSWGRNVLAPRVFVTFILWPPMMRALRESQKRLNKEIQAYNTHAYTQTWRQCPLTPGTTPRNSQNPLYLSPQKFIGTRVTLTWV